MSSREPAPKKKKPRHKVALEPISMEEILAGPGMSGFVSILDPPEQVPHLQALVDDIKDIPLPSLSKERLNAPARAQGPFQASPGRLAKVRVLHPREGVGGGRAAGRGEAEPQAGLFGEEEGGGPLAGDQKGPGVERDTPPSLPPLPGPSTLLQGHHLRRAVLAQDGHSAGEEILYQALWNSRYARQDSKESRLVTIGWKAMAKLARLTPRNTKRNCQSLVAKLAMEQLSDENSRESIGRTYRLFSYKAILERRRAAGLEWVMRSRGVAFVGAPPPPAPEPPIRILAGRAPGRSSETIMAARPEPAGEEAGAVEPVVEPVPVPERDPGVERDTGIDTVPVLVVGVLREYLPDVDDDSVVALAAACREKAPDATDAEIGYFVRLKADLMYRMGTIKSPMGFLKTAVPRCFEGESFRQFREAESKRRRSASLEQMAREREMQRFREEQRAILDNPASPEEDRRFARQFLENNS